MYHDNVKMRGYTLFLQGFSFEKIAELLRRDFSITTLSGATIRNWAEEQNWDDNRKAVRAASLKSVSEAHATKAAELKSKMERVREILYDKIVNSAPPAKSIEGMAYALKTIAEYEHTLDKESSESFHPIFVVQSMLEIFNDIPEVRKVIKAHWPRIRKEILLRIGNTDNVKVLEHEEAASNEE